MVLDTEVWQEIQNTGERAIPEGGAPAVGYGFQWLKELWERVFQPSEQPQLTPQQMLAQERRFPELRQIREPYRAKEIELYDSWKWQLNQAKTWYETQKKNLQRTLTQEQDRLKNLYDRKYITREQYYSRLREINNQYRKGMNSLNREYTLIRDKINRLHRQQIHNNRVEFGRKWYRRKAELERQAKRR